MAGGIGSRFWPMSTKECPKQFLDITGCGRTMVQQTFDRYAGIVDIDQVWVVTSQNYKDLVTQQLKEINPQHILLEPCMRNTAPCIAYASWKIRQEDADALMAVAPSDHLVLKEDAFRECVQKAFDFIASGDRILTMGMQPSRPETGYGYIEQCVETQDGIYQLKAFKEKPDLMTAIHYLQQGSYTWNSGMFFWSVNTIVKEMTTYCPGITELMDKMVKFFFTDKESEIVQEYFPQCPKISIDYAVMEKTQKAFVMPAEFGWSDLGTWGSLHTLLPHDSGNNAILGDNVKMVECNDCMVRIPNGKQVVVQGLKDYIVAEYDNTLLICQLTKEQSIKDWHD